MSVTFGLQYINGDHVLQFNDPVDGINVTYYANGFQPQFVANELSLTGNTGEVESTNVSVVLYAVSPTRVSITQDVNNTLTMQVYDGANLVLTVDNLVYQTEHAGSYEVGGGAAAGDPYVRTMLG